MKDINIKSIRYPVTIDEKLDKLALKFGRTKILFFTQMVDYFDKSKKDPSDLNDEVLKKEIASGINRIISFFRSQEKEFLLPVLTNTSQLLKITGNHTKYLHDINGYLPKAELQGKEILNRIALVDKAIAKTQMNLNDKAGLKNQFKKILDYYINHRETLGWTASNAKKEELQSHVRQSLQNL